MFLFIYQQLPLSAIQNTMKYLLRTGICMVPYIHCTAASHQIEMLDENIWLFGLVPFTLNELR